MTISNEQRAADELFLRLADVLTGAMTPGRLRAAVRLWLKLLRADRLCLLSYETGGATPLLTVAGDYFHLEQSEERWPPVPLPSLNSNSSHISDRRLSQRLFGTASDDELTLIRLGGDEEPSSILVLGTLASTPPRLLQDAGELLDAAVRRCLYDQFLRARCRELSHVLNFSDSVYVSWDREEGWSYHNINTFLEMGYEKDKIDISRPDQNNPMHAEDWDEARRLFTRALTEGRNYEHDYRAVGKDGQQRWFRAAATVIKTDDDGSACQMVSLSQDVTHLRQAAQEAVEQAELEQWLVAQTNAIFSYTDLDSLSKTLAELGRYLGVDRCAVRVVDPETESCNLLAHWERPGLDVLSQLLPEISSLPGLGWIGHLVADGKPYVINDVAAQVSDERLSGYYRQLDLEACLIEPLMHDNQLIGYLNLFHATPRNWSKTERRVAREIANAILMTIMRIRLLDELRASDERFQLAMEHSTFGLWDREVSSGTMYYSPHFYEQLGYPRQDKPIPLIRMLDYIHPDDHHKLYELAEFHKHNDEIDLELRHVKRDGSIIWMMSRGKVAERDEKGKPARVIGMNLDITEHKTIQMELAAARQVAEEANRNKSEFLERMSHEIRTPMNAIMGMTYLLLDTPLQPEQRSYITDMDAATKSLLHIIDDILDFSKIEAGELSIVNEDFDLWEEVERLTKLHHLRAREGGNELTFHLEPDVPQFVRGDKYRLGQVLTNLLGNAVKFTSNGRIDLRVRVADNDPRLKTVRLIFAVSDTGIGFKPDQLARVFEPFEQADDSTSRKFGGTGLGLSISKHLVEMMGGSIHCHSSPGEGATFEFSVVLKPSAPAQTKQRPQQPEAPQPAAKESRRTVLLVEDNPVNQRVASGILNKLMIDSVAVDNGALALQRLAESHPGEFDAILMDIEMPVLDGLTATRLIRQNPLFHSIPIIAMTAHAMVGDRERCLAAGMNEHIAKPVNPERLLNILNQFWEPVQP